MAPSETRVCPPFVLLAARSLCTSRHFLVALILTAGTLAPQVLADGAKQPGPSVAGGHTPADAKPIPASWQIAGLRAALADPSPGVQAEAFIIADCHGWDSLIEPEQAARFLEEHFQDDKFAAANAAVVRILGRMGAPARPFAERLVARLFDERGNSQSTVARAISLWSISFPGMIARSKIAALFQSPNSQTRKSAADAVACMGESGADFAPEVGVLLQDGADDVQVSAVFALGRVGPAAASFVPQVSALVGDGPDRYDGIQRTATWALGHMGPAAAAKITALLQHQDTTVRQLAFEALVQMDGHGLDATSYIVSMLSNPDKLGDSVAVAAIARLAKAGAPLAPHVAKYLSSSDAWQRYNAIEALGKMGKEGASAAAMVAARLKDDEEGVRAAAARALAAMSESRSGIEAFIGPMLNVENAGTRQAALDALAGIGKPAERYIGKIAPLLKDANGQIRGSAAEALGKMGESGAPFASNILPLLHDPSADSRLGAVEALGAMSRPGATYAAQIAPLLRDPNVLVSQGAARSLRRFGADAEPYAADIARNLFDPDLSDAALDALEDMGARGRDFAADIVWISSTSSSPHPLKALLKMGAEDPAITMSALPAFENCLQTTMFERGKGFEEEMLRVRFEERKLTTPLEFLDALGNQAVSKKDRVSWLAIALCALRASDSEQHPALRAHFRLWCGGDDRLELALNWLGEPDPPPTLDTLSPKDFQNLADVVSDLRQATSIYSREQDELDDFLEKLAASPLTISLPPEVGSKLTSALTLRRARAEALRQVLALAERTSAEPFEGSSAQPRETTVVNIDGVRPRKPPSVPPIPEATPGRIAGIRAAMADTSPQVRYEMIKLCVTNGWGRWLPPDQVVPFLKAKDAAVRDTAAEALGQMGRRGALFARQILPLLHDPYHYYGGNGVTWALAEMGKADPSVASLVASILDLPGEGSAHDQALAGLAGMGKAASPFAAKFAALLGSRLRHNALWALGQLREAGAPFTAQVAPLLHDSEDHVAEAAAETLGKFGASGAKYAGETANFLQDKSPDWTPYTAAALRAMSGADPSVPARLLPLLQNDDGGVRSNAVTALGALAPVARPWANDAVSLLRDPDPSVREAALEAINKFSRAFAPEKQPYTEVFVEWLVSQDPWQRRAAVVGLGEIGDPQFIPGVVPLLDDPDGAVQSAAARTLAKIGRGDATLPSKIAALLILPDPSVRKAALEALGEMGKTARPVAPRIELRLRDDETDLRLSAALALCRVGPEDRIRAIGFASFFRNTTYGAEVETILSLGEMRSGATPVADELISHLAAVYPYDATLTIFRALFMILGPDAKLRALATAAMKTYLDRDEDMGEGPGRDAAPDALLKFLDAFPTLSAGKSRDAWLVSALEGLHWQEDCGPNVRGQSRNQVAGQTRTHLRLWCADDERHQRALDWIGKPASTPDPASLTPTSRRMLLATFCDLWQTALCAGPARPPGSNAPGAYPFALDLSGTNRSANAAPPLENLLYFGRPTAYALVLEELAQGIERVASVSSAGADDAELATTLRQFRKTCEGMRQTIKEALTREEPRRP